MERTSLGFQLLSAGEIVMGEQTEYLAFVKHSILFKKATAMKVSYWHLAMTYSDGQGRYWFTFDGVKVFVFVFVFLILGLDLKDTTWVTIREVSLLIAQGHGAAAEAGWEPSAPFPSAEPFLPPAPLRLLRQSPLQTLLSCPGDTAALLQRPYPWATTGTTSFCVFPSSRGRPSVPSHFKSWGHSCNLFLQQHFCKPDMHRVL